MIVLYFGLAGCALAEFFSEPRVSIDIVIDRAGEALIDQRQQPRPLFILGDVAPHGFANDLAGRAEFAGFDLAAREIDEGLAERDRGVLAHGQPVPYFGNGDNRAAGRP